MAPNRTRRDLISSKSRKYGKDPGHLSTIRLLRDARVSECASRPELLVNTISNREFLIGEIVRDLHEAHSFVQQIAFLGFNPPISAVFVGTTGSQPTWSVWSSDRRISDTLPALILAMSGRIGILIALKPKSKPVDISLLGLEPL